MSQLQTAKSENTENTLRAHQEISITLKDPKNLIGSSQKSLIFQTQKVLRYLLSRNTLLLQNFHINNLVAFF